MEKIEEIINKIKSSAKTELPKDIEWKEFKLNEIFEIKNAKNINSTKIVYSNDKKICHIFLDRWKIMV